MTDYPIQPSGDKNSQNMNYVKKDMEGRGLNYGSAKLGIELMYHGNASQAIKHPIEILYVEDVLNGKGEIADDDCTIHYSYGKNNKNELLIDRVRYSELVVCEKEIVDYASMKAPNKDAIEKRVKQMQGFRFHKKGRESLIHKLAKNAIIDYFKNYPTENMKRILNDDKKNDDQKEMELQTALNAMPGIILREVSALYNEPCISKIKFTGFSCNNSEECRKNGIKPVYMISYDHYMKNVKIREGRIPIDELIL